MKKGLCVFLFSLLFCLNLSVVSVYAETVVKANFNGLYSNETDISVLLNDIVKELSYIDDGEILHYQVNTSLKAGENYSELKSNLTRRITERLDGVINVTPQITTSVYRNSDTDICERVTFKIDKYEWYNTKEYNDFLNLVSKAKKLKTDFEKIHYLGNYFYNNGFKYAYDDSIEFPSGNLHENKNRLPDGIMSRKKSVCMGFANLASEYLTELGIPNFKLRGTNPIDNGYHVWNVVYFEYNGKLDWYCVDYGVSIYGANSKRLISTYQEYLKEYNYVWESDIIEDIIDAKYSPNLSLKDYSKNRVVSLLTKEDKMELGKRWDLERLSVFSLSSKDIFNLTFYYVNKLY